MWLDAVELAGLDQRRDTAPVLAAFVVACKSCTFCGSGPVPVHSAHVGSVCRVCYRWHAYFDADVKVYRSCRRGDGTHVGLERDPRRCCHGPGMGSGCLGPRDDDTWATARVGRGFAGFVGHSDSAGFSAKL